MENLFYALLNDFLAVGTKNMLQGVKYYKLVLWNWATDRHRWWTIPLRELQIIVGYPFKWGINLLRCYQWDGPCQLLRIFTRPSLSNLEFSGLRKPIALSATCHALMHKSSEGSCSQPCQLAGRRTQKGPIKNACGRTNLVQNFRSFFTFNKQQEQIFRRFCVLSYCSNKIFSHLKVLSSEMDQAKSRLIR